MLEPIQSATEMNPARTIAAPLAISTGVRSRGTPRSSASEFTRSRRRPAHSVPPMPSPSASWTCRLVGNVP